MTGLCIFHSSVGPEWTLLTGWFWVPGPYVWHPCYKLTQHYSLSLSSASGPHPEETITPHCPLHKATPSRHWLNCNSDDRRQRRAFKRRRSSPETRWSSALLSACLHILSLSLTVNVSWSCPQHSARKNVFELLQPTLVNGTIRCWRRYGFKWSHMGGWVSEAC